MKSRMPAAKPEACRQDGHIMLHEEFFEKP